MGLGAQQRQAPPIDNYRQSRFRSTNSASNTRSQLIDVPSAAAAADVWLLAPALRRFGYESDADRIVASCIELVERHGFREYYNPLNGEGLAARRFGWSTLLIDLLGGADGGAQTASDDLFVGSLRDELRSMGAEAAGEAARRLNRRAAAAARRLLPG